MRLIPRGTQAWAGLAFGGLLLIGANAASAQSCETDSDCGAGSICHTEQYESCSGDCKPDMMCPPDSCQTVETKYCVSAPCSADADCPSSMVCYAPTSTECSGGGTMGCDPSAGGCGEPMPVDAGTECHEVTGDATCTLRYRVPCNADVDCGPGFACEEQTYTVCTGGGMGGGPAPKPGDAIDAGSGGECHTESSGTFACHLLELPCETNDDCEVGLECQRNPSVPSCGSSDAGMGTAGGSGGARDAGTPKASDVGSADCDAGAVPHHVCAPHDYYGSMNPPPVDVDGGTSNGGGSEEKDAGAAQDAGAPGGGSGGSSGGGSGDEGQGGGHHHWFPHFGCSVSGRDASSQVASWCGLLGVIAVGLRRRTRSRS